MIKQLRTLCTSLCRRPIITLRTRGVEGNVVMAQRKWKITHTSCSGQVIRGLSVLTRHLRLCCSHRIFITTNTVALSQPRLSKAHSRLILAPLSITLPLPLPPPTLPRLRRPAGVCSNTTLAALEIFHLEHHPWRLPSFLFDIHQPPVLHLSPPPACHKSQALRPRAAPPLLPFPLPCIHPSPHQFLDLSETPAVRASCRQNCVN